ncbi:MAG: hypothetical protein ABH875_06740 [Candidatus Omnitrophota bacterium]
MRRLSVLFLLVVFLSFATTVYAAADNLLDGMAKKAERGVVNTLSALWEFPAQIYKGFKNGVNGDGDNKLLGGLMGICDGVKHTLGRGISGLTDLGGFWAANPTDNEGVGLPLDAKYAWEEGEAYNPWDPSFAEASLVPMKKKFMRGTGNALLCIGELPGQLTRGIQNEDPFLGLAKGVWYTLSRAWHGVSEMLTTCLPGPKDQMGLAFDQEWPWDALQAADYTKKSPEIPTREIIKTTTGTSPGTPGVK